MTKMVTLVRDVVCCRILWMAWATKEGWVQALVSRKISPRLSLTLKYCTVLQGIGNEFGPQTLPPRGKRCVRHCIDW